MDLAPWPTTAARPVTAAGALVSSPSGEVLLVEPTCTPAREVPGGLVDVADALCGDRLSRRVRAAVAARASGDLAGIDDDGPAA